MTIEVQVGDIVRASEKGSRLIIEGEVTYKGVSMLEVEEDFALDYMEYDFEVLEYGKREVDLPTEAGLYTLATNEDLLTVCRVFSFNPHLGWHESGRPYEEEDTEKELKEGIKKFGWKLRRLTFAGKA